MRFNMFTTAVVAAFSLAACDHIQLQSGDVAGQFGVGPGGVTASVVASAIYTSSNAADDVQTPGGEAFENQHVTEEPQKKGQSNLHVLKATLPLSREQALHLALIETAAEKHSVDARTLATIGWLESRLRNIQSRRSSAAGPMQFITATADLYGLKDPMDPQANIDAGARLMKDNAVALRNAFGEEPSPFSLYMAHMQGVAGYLKLLRNTARNASDVVGQREFLDNTTGKHDATAAEFLEEWDEKFQRAYAVFRYRE